MMASAGAGARPGGLTRIGSGIATWLGQRRVRVMLLTALLAGMAAAIYFGLLVNVTAPRPPSRLEWPLFAAGFFVVDAKVVNVYYRRERHSFSLSEIPAVLGMFYLTPPEYLTALLVGSGVALLLTAEQSPLKILFNLANYAFLGSLTLMIFTAFAARTGIPGAGDWLAAFTATAIAAVAGAVTIAAVITISGGAPQFERLPEMAQFSALVAIANTSLALLTLMASWESPAAVALVVVAAAILFVGYRAYVSEKEKHQRLELVYESSRIMQHSRELDSAILAVLRHAREMFRAERAEFILLPQPGGTEALRTACDADGWSEQMTPVILHPNDSLLVGLAREPHAHFEATDTTGPRQQMVSPLVAENGLMGVMRIATRRGEGSFTDDDLRLLETLANQAASALENGQLEQSLAELSRLKEQLRHQAYHDPLTGLANRTLFIEAVEERLCGDASPVVLFLDLDDFKLVNDTQGHATGDHLLSAVADRVRGALDEDDLPARLGGDEFAILLATGATLEHGSEVARALVEALQLPFVLRGLDVSVGVSIGIAGGRPGARADELLRDADVAMYAAKAGGKRQLVVFDPAMHAAIIARHKLGTDLVRAVTHGDITVHYQPIVGLGSGRPVGVEALARWLHPERGNVSPTEFVKVAEEDGSILVLGRLVLAEACATVADWQRTIPSLSQCRVNVNVSARQLRDPEFVTTLEQIMASSGLDPATLALEVTETAMLLDTESTLATFAELKRLGVGIAVDDFGTGYSSLGYLRRFPVDALKIAAEFVPGPGRDVGDWLVANTVVALGRAMGLDVIAEGIEEPEQLENLRDIGCPHGQGFLFGRPVEAAAAAAALAAAVAGRREPAPLHIRRPHAAA